MTFYFNGAPVEAFEGEGIAAALYASGMRATRRGAVGPEGLFCMIGKCSTYLVTVDGVPHVRACREPVREGLVVESEPDGARFLQNRPHVVSHWRYDRGELLQLLSRE